jgi:hypothetical protein
MSDEARQRVHEFGQALQGLNAQVKHQLAIADKAFRKIMRTIHDTRVPKDVAERLLNALDDFLFSLAFTKPLQNALKHLRPSPVSAAIEELRAMVKRLSPRDRESFFRLAVGMFAGFLDADTEGKLAEALDRNRKIKKEPDRDEILEALEQKHEDGTALILALMAYQRGGETRHARTRKRDAEIVRLRDEKKKSFGWIGKHFGISRDAAEKAYHRAKK